MLSNNKVKLAISIIGAIIIWAYVTAVINPTDTKTIQGVEVELANRPILAKDGLVVSSAEKRFVNVKVRGPLSVIDSLEAQDISASVNMVGADKGTNHIPVTLALPDNVMQVEVIPSALDIPVEELITVTKPIELSYTDPFPAGMEPGFIDVNPTEIEVAGTKEGVGNVTRIEAIIDSSRLSKTASTQTVEAIPENSAGERVSDLTLSRTTIDINLTLCYVKEVPLNIKKINKSPTGSAVTDEDIPKTIFIRGAQKDLDKVKEIKASDIDLSTIKETTRMIPNLQLPKGIELANASKDLSVYIEIKGVETKTLTFNAEDIELMGVRQDYTAHVNTGVISVMVLAPGDVLSDLKRGDILPYVDLTQVDFSNESVDLPVMFRYERKIANVISTPASVHVIIAREPAAGNVSY